MKNTIIVIYRSNDLYELPVKLCDTIEDASKWIGCPVSTLYNQKHLTNKMQANGYCLELVLLDNKEE